MLNSVGIDRGRTGDREISVNVLSGVANQGLVAPVISQFVALPSSGLTFRKLFLPKANKNVRQQVINEELSYSLPFPLTEAHYGMVERGEEAWVTVASDAVVQPVKELHPKAQLEAEPLCYLRAAKVAGIQQALVVDFGASKTVFCGLENGQVGTVRVMLRGGETLNQLLCQELELSDQEAELLKREEGLENPIVRRFYLELVEEALLPSPLPYTRVLLCGGGSAAPGLLSQLSKHWGRDVDVEPFPLPGLLMPVEHVVAYGAALAGRPKAPRLKMQHSFSQVRSSGGRLAWLPLLFALALVGVMVFGLETRIRSEEQRVQELRSTLNDALDPVLAKASSIKEKEIVDTLRTQLEKQRQSAIKSPGTIMNTLGKCANAVTSKESASLFSAIYEEGKLKLEGRANSLPQSEDIKTSLEKVLREAQMKTRPGPDGSFIFRIEAKVPQS